MRSVVSSLTRTQIVQLQLLVKIVPIMLMLSARLPPSLALFIVFLGNSLNMFTVALFLQKNTLGFLIVEVLYVLY